jgi:hypothetical protein
MEKKFFKLNAELDTNIGFGEILEDLKKLSKWLLTSPLMLLLTHPIINFGVINNYLPEKSVNVELKKPTPEKSPKSTKRKIPLPKKKEKCHCV